MRGPHQAMPCAFALRERLPLRAAQPQSSNPTPLNPQTLSLRHAFAGCRCRRRSRLCARPQILEAPGRGVAVARLRWLCGSGSNGRVLLRGALRALALMWQGGEGRGAARGQPGCGGGAAHDMRDAIERARRVEGGTDKECLACGASCVLDRVLLLRHNHHHPTSNFRALLGHQVSK